MALTEEHKFQSLLKEKNHKEIIGVLTKILEKLDKEPPLEGVTKILKDIADKPKDTEIPESIKAISKLIVEKLDEIKETHVPKPTEWKFDVHYTKEDKIDYVSVTAQSNV